MWRLLRTLSLVLVALLLAGLVLAWLLLRNSLPSLDGEIAVLGLAAPVTIERDERGTVTVSGDTRADVAYGLGYVHAQDRYFQMDLGRRYAAGELSELFGPVALEHDRAARLFRFRRVARAIIEGLPREHRAQLDAYVRGVNAGIEALRSRPWEYWVLGRPPEPWRDEDTVLIVHSMWWQLQYGGFRAEQRMDSLQQGLVKRAGEQAAMKVLAFLLPARTPWDAPVDEDPDALSLAAIPDATLWSFTPRSAAHRTPAWPDEAMPGSNNWALAGSLTASGAALVANDMHLGLEVPPTWYRARLRVKGWDDLNGVTLAGTPLLVVGSNGRIAWGFTNSYGDWLDLRWVPCDLEANTWRTLDGSEKPLFRDTVRIRVKGRKAPEEMLIREGAEGVVFDSRQDGEGTQCQLATWLATVPQATTFGLATLERAQSVAEVMALVPQIGIPHQNLVVGDGEGHIGWTILGFVPEDRGALRAFDRDRVEPAEHPMIVDPKEGRLWSANARVVSGAMELHIGDDEASVGAGYDIGARSAQIRDDLRAIPKPAAPADMLEVQLDDRGRFLEPWRSYLLTVLDDAAIAASPRRAELRRLIEKDEGESLRAEPRSVSYALVRSVHRALVHSMWSAVLVEIGEPADAWPPPPQFAAVTWRLLQGEPDNWLPPPYESWQAYALAQVDAALSALPSSCTLLASCTWDTLRPVRIGHPLASALPIPAGWLDMHVPPLAGDHDMPRVQANGFGASERFAVSPGHEDEGYLQLAGGASGHPLSPFYRSGFDDWALGRPTPFLPGPARHKLTLR